MSLTHLIAFLIPTLALNVTPGPDLFFVIGQSLRGGPGGTCSAAAGLWCGYFFHIVLVSAGMATVLIQFPAALAAIRWVGASYLFYLGLNQWIGRPRKSGGTSRTNRPLRAGFFVSAMNPKVAIFFLAFLPQFLEPQLGHPARQLFALGLLFSVTSTIVNLTFGLSACWLRQQRGEQARAPWLEKACGLALVGMAARIVAL